MRPFFSYHAVFLLVFYCLTLLTSYHWTFNKKTPVNKSQAFDVVTTTSLRWYDPDQVTEYNLSPQYGRPQCSVLLV